ncbi:hypothetical protein IV102_08770 [bacterium]|nr:hypothetical protein [bacterium]
MNVEYQQAFAYRYDELSGTPQPILALDLVHPDEPRNRIAFDGYLDTGCSRTLLDGRLAVAAGLDPTRGRLTPYTSATGVSIRAALLKVHLAHPLVGEHELEVGFAQVNLALSS